MCSTTLHDLVCISTIQESQFEKKKKKKERRSECSLGKSFARSTGVKNENRNFVIIIIFEQPS